MPKYAILRDWPSDLSREQIDGSVLEGLVAMRLYNTYCRHINGVPAEDESLDSVRDVAERSGFDFDPAKGPGVRWIRSYWAPGTRWATCLFEASNLAALTHYHSTCDQDGGVNISEIVEVASDRFADEAGETLAPPDGWELLAVDGQREGGAPESADAVTEQMEALAALPPLKGDSDAHWVRAYYDAENQRALGLFAAAPQEGAATATPGLEARRIVEIRPEDYLA